MRSQDSIKQKGYTLQYGTKKQEAVTIFGVSPQFPAEDFLIILTNLLRVRHDFLELAGTCSGTYEKPIVSCRHVTVALLSSICRVSRSTHLLNNDHGDESPRDKTVMLLQET